MLTSLTPLPLVAARRWAVESQQRARRNAMVAATECAQRRAEREDVDDFFAALTTSPSLPAPTRPDPHSQSGALRQVP